ncbi:hypothetical protein DID88_005619 [Monilinia fructigena]|uniref:Uncharacterized protein n=1 Tax=Monilinia fructigena TaxID=38457 RepID=A0A395J1G6_9HELO|nr:hypothetical protein DID88_005619 [Monilinia fructigena]
MLVYSSFKRTGMVAGLVIFPLRHLYDSPLIDPRNVAASSHFEPGTCRAQFLDQEINIPVYVCAHGFVGICDGVLSIALGLHGGDNDAGAEVEGETETGLDAVAGVV